MGVCMSQEPGDGGAGSCAGWRGDSRPDLGRGRGGGAGMRGACACGSGWARGALDTCAGLAQGLTARPVAWLRKSR